MTVSTRSYVTKKIKKLICADKIVNFIVIHVYVYVFSNIDSAIIECLRVQIFSL